MVVTKAAEKVIKTLRERAAKIWKIDAEAVTWENGEARPAGDNAGKFEPLSLAQIAAKASETGGPIGAGSSLNTEGRRGRLRARTSATSRSIRDTGKVQVMRYTAFQDVGRAIHPELCRGPDPGRRRPGHRLGAERGVHLRQATASSITRASSTTACPSPPTCR